MNLKRIIIAILFVLPLSCKAAFARAMPFCDVTEQTPYYTAIDRLYDTGTLRGYEDGTFKPNDKISVAEGITLAENLFGNTSALPDEWQNWFSDKCGWNNHINLNSYLFRGDYSAVMTYETASELLLKLKNLPLIDSSMWDTKIKYGGFSDYTNTMYVRGYEERISFYGIPVQSFAICLTLCLTMTEHI